MTAPDPLAALRWIVGRAAVDKGLYEPSGAESERDGAAYVIVHFIVSPEAVEIIAQALVDEEWDGTQPDFAHKPPSWRARYMGRATAVLQAIAAKGVES